ncbi:hypothetical protein FF38_07305 [Lucilia cuprina]|uniref:Methuselah N-terminal domain-containing protein n=1 Tax=Lucilia cuprina TaxID=7375 RepID=A0A0L0BQL3_LUCCU|nr:uncharacterized protein LOC111689294 [Lucilia cuprina]XP_037826956.1 uncharacterized protein LOC119614941 [Lucilia sericata]KNC22301.1 hypothetical protein FF38_07305 [Lucilia cuprina]
MWQNKQQFTIFTNLVLILTQFLSEIYCLQEKGTDGKPLAKAATFHFPEYAYKETSKNELTYHDFEVNCEHHVACENLEGVKRKACVRRCISYSCYQDIYAFDELEEGEIDVRLNSFKGCVIQRTGNTNRRAT